MCEQCGDGQAEGGSALQAPQLASPAPTHPHQALLRAPEGLEDGDAAEGEAAGAWAPVPVDLITGLALALPRVCVHMRIHALGLSPASA